MKNILDINLLNLQGLTEPSNKPIHVFLFLLSATFGNEGTVALNGQYSRATLFGISYTLDESNLTQAEKVFDLVCDIKCAHGVWMVDLLGGGRGERALGT
ncbi:hypothetical protein ACJX0J_035934 [Zea mays]